MAIVTGTTATTAQPKEVFIGIISGDLITFTTVSAGYTAFTVQSQTGISSICAYRISTVQETAGFTGNVSIVPLAYNDSGCVATFKGPGPFKPRITQIS